MTMGKLKLPLIAAIMAVSGAATAQDYPSQTVHLILPYNPGGIVDGVGRTIASGLSEVTGQSVVPENRPGAGGVVGSDSVVNSQADGHTILLMDPAIVTLPHLRSDLPFDPLTDLKAVSVVSSSPLVLVVSPDLPVETFEDFVEYVRDNPGTLNYASAGIGTTPHLAAELFLEEAGLEANHVPYNGIAPSFADLMAGVVQFSFSSLSGAQPFTADDRVRALATTGSERNPAYPDLPTIEEAADMPGFEIDLWLAVFAPAGIDDSVAQDINSYVQQVIEQDAFAETLGQFGLTPRGTSVDEAASFVEDEYARWGEVIGGIETE